MRPIAAALVLLLSISIAGPASTQTESCDSIEKEKKASVRRIFMSQRPYACCDETILKCLSKEPVCPLVERLADEICQKIDAGVSPEMVEKELSLRLESARGAKFDIDIGKSVPAGDPDAPVEIVAYVCARCPFCAIFTLDLYKAVTSGTLKGKAKFYIRPFVLRGHTGATAGGMAMLAAREMGRFWVFLQHMYENFDQFDSAKLPDDAAQLGMDADRFRLLMEDPELRNDLVAAKKEGLRNGVEGTPTFYINRRKYVAELMPKTFKDFVLGEYERLAMTAVEPNGSSR